MPGIGVGTGVASLRRLIVGITPPTPAALQAVATRGEVPVSQGGLTTANNRRLQGRTRHYFGPAAISEFQVGYASFHVGDWTTGNVLPEIAAPLDTQIQLYVEFNNVSVRATFNGQNIGVLPGGSHLFCDPILPAQFGLTEFPANGQFWCRFEKDANINNRHQYSKLSTEGVPPISGEVVMFGNASAVSRISGTGSMATTGWTSFDGYQLPIAIIGRPKAPMAAWGIVGASIEHGAGDANRGDGENGGGYVRRALWPTKQPYISIARGSEAAFSFQSNSAMRRPLMQYCNRILCGHGGNDYSYGYSVETTQIRLARIWELMKQASPSASVHQVLLSPKTDSTDAWATIANQTPRAGYEPNGAWRNAIDTWTVGQASSNPNLNGVFNLTPSQEPAANPARWRVDLGQPTTDGTHPTASVHAAMATLLRTLMPGGSA